MQGDGTLKADIPEKAEVPEVRTSLRVDGIESLCAIDSSCVSGAVPAGLGIQVRSADG